MLESGDSVDVIRYGGHAERGYSCPSRRWLGKWRRVKFPSVQARRQMASRTGGWFDTTHHKSSSNTRNLQLASSEDQYRAATVCCGLTLERPAPSVAVDHLNYSPSHA